MTNTFTVNEYSPKDVILTIGGYQLVGWQSVTISRNAKIFNPYRGIRGKHTRIKNKDTSATLNIYLLLTSQGNDVLSTILLADEENGTSRLALTLKDKSGNSVYSSNEAYLTNYPVATYSGQFEYRNWEIFCQSTQNYNVGGNAKSVSTLLANGLSELSDFVGNIF